MISANRNIVKADISTTVDMSEDTNNNTQDTNYGKLLGLVYNKGNSENLPRSLKWGRSFINLADY